MDKKLKTVFMGTPDICIPCLELLKDHPQIELHTIVSMPDRPKGRGMQMQSPEVASFAKENDITLFQTPKINSEEEFLSQLESNDIDLIIVFAFAQFLNERVLKLPKIACLNIHTSLLPKYRGAAPIQYAILNGDKETGVSIQRMVKKMDAGDIAHIKKIDIDDNETSAELYNKLKNLSKDCLNELIERITNDQLSFSTQDETGVSFAPTIKKEEGHLNFKELSFEQIRNKIRAYTPWPGTFCILNGKRLKVFSIEEYQEDLTPGQISKKSGFLVIGCKDKSIRLKEIQIEGKKRSFDVDILNGLRSDITIS